MVKCIYCGEEEATRQILNPNVSEDDMFWDVCETCEKVIALQSEWSFTMMMKDIAPEPREGYWDEKIEIINNKINELSKEIGKPIFTAMISKKDDELH